MITTHPSQTHPSPEWLLAYGQGRLAGAAADTVEAHLTECSECLHHVEVAPDDALIGKVRAALPHLPTSGGVITRTEYQRLTPFARGGLGEVLLAHDALVGRDVAVKRLLSRDEHPERRKRFLREAAITARLEHPGIAPVYGVGEDETGQPCYAMRFVPGKTLADAIREQHASGSMTEPGLRLLLARFVALCATVAYAHSRGVVHRDIKPDNIAVGSFGETILLDWGLAQTNDIDPVPTPYTTNEASSPFDRFQTRTGTVLGTPGFMAPEQARGERVSPAADVYSLGVTLAVILMGHLPPERLPKSAPKKYRALWAIVQRATALESEHRYGDALALAGDVERWLADEPVLVYREPRFVRLLRWVRHHQTFTVAVVVLLLAVFVALGIGVVLVGNEQRRTAKALEAESEQRTRAEDRAAETAAVLQFVDQYVFTAGRPKGRQGGLGRDVTLAAAVTLASAAVERSFSGQPLTEARVRSMLGTTFQTLGDANAAAQQFAVARTLYEQHRGADHPDTLSTLNNLATSYRSMGRGQEALELDEAVAERRQAILGPEHPDTLKSLHNLANSYAALNRHEDALRLDRTVYERRRATLGPDHPDTLMSMGGLATSHYFLGQDEECLKLREEVYQRTQALFGRDHADTVIAQNNLANIYGELGRHQEAVAMFEEVVQQMIANSGPKHADTLTAKSNLARSYGALKRWDDALALHRAVLGLRRETLPPDHPDIFLTMYNFASTLLDMGRGAEAITEFDAIVRQAVGKTIHPQIVSKSLEKRLRYFAERNNLEECQRTATTWEKQMRPTPDALVQAARLRAICSRLAGSKGDDADRAVAWLNQALAAGYQNRRELETNRDFDALRTHPDFKKFLEKFVPSPK